MNSMEFIEGEWYWIRTSRSDEEWIPSQWKGFWSNEVDCQSPVAIAGPILKPGERIFEKLDQELVFARAGKGVGKIEANAKKVSNYLAGQAEA